MTAVCVAPDPLQSLMLAGRICSMRHHLALLLVLPARRVARGALHEGDSGKPGFRAQASRTGRRRYVLVVNIELYLGMVATLRVASVRA